MNNINTAITRSTLKQARELAKKIKIKIPKLTTWCDSIRGNYYQVWADNDVVWEGAAWDAYEAKANYIYQVLGKDLDRILEKEGE